MKKSMFLLSLCIISSISASSNTVNTYARYQSNNREEIFSCFENKTKSQILKDFKNKSLSEIITTFNDTINKSFTNNKNDNQKVSALMEFVEILKEYSYNYSINFNCDGLTYLDVRNTREHIQKLKDIIALLLSKINNLEKSIGQKDKFIMVLIANMKNDLKEIERPLNNIGELLNNLEKKY